MGDCATLNLLPLVENHVVAVIKGKESYEILQSSCSKIFKDINKIVENGFVEIEDDQVAVEMFVGGDYKVCFDNY